MLGENLEKLIEELPAEERAAAKEALDRYLLLAWEIWEESQSPKSPD